MGPHYNEARRIFVSELALRVTPKLEGQVKEMLHPVAVALGSNQGDRLTYIQRGFQELRKLGKSSLQCSAIWETAAVDCLEPLPFLNAVASFQTKLTPQELLSSLLTIERSLGRQRRYRNAPRTLDLDLLFWGQAVIDEPELQVPHPALHLRHFVLQPLSEVCPNWVHPVLGKTCRDLLQELNGTHQPAFPLPTLSQASR